MILIIYSVYAVSFVAELPNSRRKEIEAIHSVLRSEVRKIIELRLFFFEAMKVSHTFISVLSF